VLVDRRPQIFEPLLPIAAGAGHVRSVARTAQLS
jgi:hypothetical protein